MKNTAKREVANDTSQTIIDGALSVMVEQGIASLTTKSVSKKADVSTAAIHYFFDTKDLLEARKSEDDPIKRLRRSIDVFFGSGQVSEDAAKIWPQLWVYAGSDQKARRLFNIYNSRLISNFTYDICALGVARPRARLLAFKLNALHRGLWIEQQVGAPISHADCSAILDMAMAEVVAEL